MGKGFYVTGTDNGVGKTYVAALLAKKLNRNGLATAYYKVNGCAAETEHVKQVSGIMQDAEAMIAAAVDGAAFGAMLDEYDCVVAEGCGAVTEGINEEAIEAFAVSSVLVVQPNAEGADAADVASKYMKASGIPVKGIIYNRCNPGSWAEDNMIFEIEQRTGLRTVAKVAEGAQEIDIEISEISVLFRA